MIPSSAPIVEKHAVRFCSECKRFLSFCPQIAEYGKVVTETSDPHGERFSFYHRLNYITEGEAFYPGDTENIAVGPGCLMYLPPNITPLIPEGSHVEMYFVNFTLGAPDKSDEFRETMERLFRYHHVHDKDGELRKILEAIRRIGAENKFGAGLEIQNLFENLFFHIVRLSDRYHAPQHGSAAPGADVNLNRAMQYINENLRRNFTVSEMAQSLNISENYLYKLMVRHTGKSPSVFLADLRLELAKNALQNPIIPIKTIGSRLGYHNSAHFSTVFKKKYGVSPLAYRRALTKERAAEMRANTSGTENVETK
ncbi:MAG: AraC family transcriptional regulator [Clostridia bacterium]|nr:AraC family transcriptional regulator [Clostridia bacterium]